MVVPSPDVAQSKVS